MNFHRWLNAEALAELHCGDVIGRRDGVEEVVRAVVRRRDGDAPAVVVQVGTRAGANFYGYVVSGGQLTLNWGPLHRGDPNTPASQVAASHGPPAAH